MSFTLDQLKASFQNNTAQDYRPNNYYPFWLMNDGEQAVVRFLPDKNEDNSLGFMVEKLYHVLKINGENKSVPCLKMYNEDCPICNVSQTFYKQEDKENGKKYYRKKQHIVQALIVEDPLPPDDTTKENHEGKVRFLSLGFQLFNIIKDAFESGELDEIPFAYEGGCDFIIKKTKQGEYSTYTVGSKFARKSTDLSEDEVAMVTEHLADLSTLLPANPGLEKVEAMLEAAMTGSDYVENNDSDSDNNFKDKVQTAVSQSSNSEQNEEDENFEDEAEQLLAQIRSRKQAN